MQWGYRAPGMLTHGCLLGMWNSTTILKTVFQLNIHFSYNSESIPFLGIYPSEMKTWYSYRILCMNVYNNSMHHHQMMDKFQLSCSAWVNNLWFINIMGNYSAIKRNGLLTHGTAWLDLKVTILGEIRQQFQETIYCMILFTWKSQKVKSVVTENRSEVARE